MRHMTKICQKHTVEIGNEELENKYQRFCSSKALESGLPPGNSVNTRPKYNY